MEDLCARLGNPERSFRVIHVVGTNGKSSVTEACRQLLAGEDVRAGAYLSPHLGSWAERVRLPDDNEDEALAGSLTRVADAVAEMASGACEAGAPTQFEVATAAAFLALARDDADVAAIEAGLGGRLDATNVCSGEVVVLTTVALEHTEWLGDTVEAIAKEKLAVLDPGATLVLGRVGKEVMRVATELAATKGARLVEVFEPSDVDSVHPSDETDTGTRNFAADNATVAAAAVEALLGRPPGGGATPAPLPARGQLIESDPPVMLDLAHNPAAAAALAADPRLAGRPVVACVALLDDKDHEGFAAVLGPALDELIATQGGELGGAARPGARWHDPAAIAASFSNAGVPRTSFVSDPRQAVETTIGRARATGAIALITGSHYLLAHEWIPGRDRSYSG